MQAKRLGSENDIFDKSTLRKVVNFGENGLFLEGEFGSDDGIRRFD